ncbi:MAG: sigma 54-interacting transcriptional regulator, partial [Acidobacteria bacterium]|nr:sigma 54-interacting transcriptional regulator [Acidobacteriota bacterium]
MSLGRALICLDERFFVMHASPALDELVGEGARAAAVGRPVEEVLGGELFGGQGTLRRALEAGERREGWGATVRVPGAKPRLVSISVAPLRHDLSDLCDPFVRYLVVLRPAEQWETTGGSGVTLFSGLVARSPVMMRIFELVENLHESDATVLITGESGTGKELIARAIHQHSRRRSGPFVAVNCGALPPDLLESELFGHVRGAFTGAIKDRVGRFELASAGTLFLDEIGDLPLHLQVKLLRVLQEHSFERVGESVSRRTEARIIAATNADLARAMLAGRFRDDLFYRLRVVPIEVPPLHQRREDIEPLARFLLVRVGERHGRILRLAPDAIRTLLRYSWPGNVRELENALEYAVAVGQGGETLHAEDLPPELLAGAPTTLPAAEMVEPMDVPHGNETRVEGTGSQPAAPAP